MDDKDAGPQQPQDLISRSPSEQDLVSLCRHLNQQQAKYIVVGGFAIIHAGFPRPTFDLDLLIAVDPENEARVFKALESLPDKAVRQLSPGETSRFNVIRVADEIIVDLMRSGAGIEYAEAAAEIVYHDIRGVRIPFASPRLLWRMKKPTHRAKDAPDLMFLLEWFRSQGLKPPD